MTQEEKKRIAAKAALAYVEEDGVIGVGTGSTVNYFIELLASIQHKIRGTVASSLATEARLKSYGFPVLELNSVSEIPVYIDSADVYTPYCQLIKGKGGALTREKILCAASRQFVCIVDDSKHVRTFSDSLVPIEVIPMARSFVAREIVKLGGMPVYRQDFITDNGNILLDVHHWDIPEPIQLGRTLNNIPGIIGHGLFADCPADCLVVGTAQGIQIIKNNSQIAKR